VVTVPGQLPAGFLFFLYFVGTRWGFFCPTALIQKKIERLFFFHKLCSRGTMHN
jgi:hypothetical protein